MKKYFIYLPIILLILISSKLFAPLKQTTTREFVTARKRGTELIEKIAKRYAESMSFPTREEIKELKGLTPYLPKKGDIADKDFSEMIKVLNSIPDSALEEPKTEQEKAIIKKYNNPNLKPEDA
jgi:hypothetical protein